jgi:hypothetical protein
MPKNEYGPDDPESLAVDRLSPLAGTALFESSTGEVVVNKGPSVCECGALAVTMRVAPSRGSKTPAGKVGLIARCAACAERDAKTERDAALRDLGKRRKAIADEINVEMRGLYRDRRDRDPSSAWVSVIDARRVYRRTHPQDPKEDLRWLGGLFRARGWVKVGRQALNSDEGNHARPVECWRLKESAE